MVGADFFTPGFGFGFFCFFSGFAFFGLGFFGGASRFIFGFTGDSDGPHTAFRAGASAARPDAGEYND
jgi:hypothetical protein